MNIVVLPWGISGNGRVSGNVLGEPTGKGAGLGSGPGYGEGLRAGPVAGFGSLTGPGIETGAGLKIGKGAGLGIGAGVNTAKGFLYDCSVCFAPAASIEGMRGVSCCPIIEGSLKAACPAITWGTIPNVGKGIKKAPSFVFGCVVAVCLISGVLIVSAVFKSSIGLK